MLRSPPPEAVLDRLHALQVDFFELSAAAIASRDPRVEYWGSLVGSDRVRTHDLLDGRTLWAMALEQVGAELRSGALRPESFGVSGWEEVTADRFIARARGALERGLKNPEQLLGRAQARAQARAAPAIERPSSLSVPRSFGSLAFPETAALLLAEGRDLEPALGAAVRAAEARSMGASEVEARREAWLHLAYAQATATTPPSVLAAVPAAAATAGLDPVRWDTLEPPPSTEELERRLAEGEILHYVGMTGNDGRSRLLVLLPKSGSELGQELAARLERGELEHLSPGAVTELVELFDLGSAAPGRALDEALDAQRAGVERRQLGAEIALLVALSFASRGAASAGAGVAARFGLGPVLQRASAFMLGSASFTAGAQLAHGHVPGAGDFARDAVLFAALGRVAKVAQALGRALPAASRLATLGRDLAAEGFGVAAVAGGMTAYERFVEGERGREVAEQFARHLLVVGVLHTTHRLLDRLPASPETDAARGRLSLAAELTDAAARDFEASVARGDVTGARRATRRLRAAKLLAQLELESTESLARRAQAELDAGVSERLASSDRPAEARLQDLAWLAENLEAGLLHPAVASQRSAVASAIARVLKERAAVEGRDLSSGYRETAKALKSHLSKEAHQALQTELGTRRAPAKPTERPARTPLDPELAKLQDRLPETHVRRLGESKAIEPELKAKTVEWLDRALRSGQVDAAGLGRWLKSMARVDGKAGALEQLAELERAVELVETGQVQGTLVMSAKKGSTYQLTDAVSVKVTNIPDVDILYLDKAGTLHAVEVKHTANALRDKTFGKKRDRIDKKWMDRLRKWQDEKPGREAEVYVRKEERWTEMLYGYEIGGGKVSVASQLAKYGLNVRVARYPLSTQAGLQAAHARFEGRSVPKCAALSPRALSAPHEARGTERE